MKMNVIIKIETSESISLKNKRRYIFGRVVERKVANHANQIRLWKLDCVSGIWGTLIISGERNILAYAKNSIRDIDFAAFSKTELE